LLAVAKPNGLNSSKNRKMKLPTKREVFKLLIKEVSL